MTDYTDFLKAKIAIERAHGLACDPWEINTKLFPHQQDIVRWAVQGGQMLDVSHLATGAA